MAKDLQLSDSKYAYGARRAWSAVLGSFLLQAATVGLLTSFGVTQTFYVNHYLSKSSSSAISWIGSVSLFLELGIPLIVGNLGGRFHYRLVLGTGSCIFVFSLFMLSLARPEQYYQIILTQGVGMGLGVGIIYLPLFVIVSEHFRARKALAMGIVASSSSCGSIVFSIALNYLLNGSLGFGWSIRIIGFAVLLLLALGILLVPDTTKLTPSPLPSPLPLEKEKPLGDLASTQTVSADLPLPTFEEKQQPVAKPLWRDLTYLFICFEGFVISFGTWFPAFYVQLFVQQRSGGHIPAELTFYAIAVMNAGNAAGRIFPNYLADRFGALRVYAVCVTCCAGVTFAMLGCTTIYGLILFTVIYGFFFGATVSLYLPVVATITPNEIDVGKRMGYALFPVAVATLVGTPINGAILTDQYVWWRGILFSALALFLGAIFVFLAAFWHERESRRSARDRVVISKSSS